MCRIGSLCNIPSRRLLKFCDGGVRLRQHTNCFILAIGFSGWVLLPQSTAQIQATLTEVARLAQPFQLSIGGSFLGGELRFQASETRIYLGLVTLNLDVLGIASGLLFEPTPAQAQTVGGLHQRTRLQEEATEVVVSTREVQTSLRFVGSRNQQPLHQID